MKYFVDENVKNTVRVFPEQGRYGYYRYDMNENPQGLPKEFVESVLSKITPEFLSVYPEPDRFLNKYAEFVGANYDNVLTTNGSDMAIRYILQVFGEKGKNVVTVSPSFEMYWVNCKLLGLNHVPIEYEKDWTIKIEKLLGAIDEATRIVVLLNPNNPIGTVYTQQELEAVVKKASSVGAIVIVDEAYHYFYPNTFIEYALKSDNVIVLRTFSKLFSLAALRLGVVISNPEIIHYIKNLRLTFEANSVALLFAERILERPDIIKKLIEEESAGKAYAVEALEKAGYECKPCQGNFMFVKTNRSAKIVAEELKRKKKVLVHPYGNDLLKDYIRVSVGSREAMQIFTDALLEIDKVE